MAVLMLVGCTDDRAFRPIDDIPPVSCMQRDSTGVVYGSVLIGTATHTFGDVKDVTNASVSPPVEMITDGTIELDVSSVLAADYAMVAGEYAYATSLTTMTDCADGATRFEMHFQTGALSGWYVPAYSGW